MPFTCSICGEASTRICARCTKDACDNHICEKCLRCSDCCECEVSLEEPPRPVVRPAVEVEEEAVVEPEAEAEAETVVEAVAVAEPEPEAAETRDSTLNSQFPENLG